MMNKNYSSSSTTIPGEDIIWKNLGCIPRLQIMGEGFKQNNYTITQFNQAISD